MSRAVNNKAAIPEEATAIAILESERTLANIVLNKNDFTVPHGR